MFSVSASYDIAYGAEPLQKLDLYRPDTDKPVPVVAYFHGGGFQAGDKKDDAEKRLIPLARLGVAVASVNYRLAPDAIYPSQVHDAKAAVAHLRAHGTDLGLATDTIGAWGASAGGYLASMLGTTNSDHALAGDADPQAVRVDCVINWFGGIDLQSNASRSWLETLLLDPPVESALLGIENPAAGGPGISDASPLGRISSDAVPFLVVHGDRDRIVNIGESQAFHDRLVRAGVESTLVTLGGAGHEAGLFDSDFSLSITAGFLNTHLGPAGTE